MGFNAETTRCAVGYSTGAIRVFDVDKIDLEAKFVAHDCAVEQLMYSPDSRVIISASAKGVIVISSAAAGSTLRVFSDHKGSRITCFDTTLGGVYDPANKSMGKYSSTTASLFHVHK